MVRDRVAWLMMTSDNLRRTQYPHGLSPAISHLKKCYVHMYIQGSYTNVREHLCKQYTACKYLMQLAEQNNTYHLSSYLSYSSCLHCFPRYCHLHKNISGVGRWFHLRGLQEPFLPAKNGLDTRLSRAGRRCVFSVRAYVHV